MMCTIRRPNGFVLVEMLMVIGLVALMAAVGAISYSALWGNLKFKSQARELVEVFQMAQDAAASSDRRYQVFLNRTVQGYVFREYTETQLYYDDNMFENAEAGEYDDSIIKMKYFNVKSMYLESAEFDYYTEADLAQDLDAVDVYHFIAGRSGWQSGGRVVILDEDDQPWTIVIHRLGSPVELLKGEWDLESLGMLPKYQEEVPF